MFKVGDRVKCVNVNMEPDGSCDINDNYARYLGYSGVVVEVDDEILDIKFDKLGRRRMYSWRFERVSSLFGLDVKFDNVDDAIALATKLAKELGRPVGVVSA